MRTKTVVKTIESLTGTINLTHHAEKSYITIDVKPTVIDEPNDDFDLTFNLYEQHVQHITGDEWIEYAYNISSNGLPFISRSITCEVDDKKGRNQAQIDLAEHAAICLRSPRISFSYFAEIAKEIGDTLRLVDLLPNTLRPPYDKLKRGLRLRRLLPLLTLDITKVVFNEYVE